MTEHFLLDPLGSFGMWLALAFFHPIAECHRCQSKCKEMNHVFLVYTTDKGCVQNRGLLFSKYSSRGPPSRRRFMPMPLSLPMGPRPKLVLFEPMALPPIMFPGPPLPLLLAMLFPPWPMLLPGPILLLPKPPELLLPPPPPPDGGWSNRDWRYTPQASAQSGMNVQPTTSQVLNMGVGRAPAGK